MMDMDGKQDFDIRKKYCPAVRQNVVFKIDNTEPKNEICMDSANCENHTCEWNSNRQKNKI